MTIHPIPTVVKLDDFFSILLAAKGKGLKRRKGGAEVKCENFMSLLGQNGSLGVVWWFGFFSVDFLVVLLRFGV